MTFLVDCTDCGKEYLIDIETLNVIPYDNYQGIYGKDTTDDLTEDTAEKLHGVTFTCQCGAINRLEHWTRVIHRVIVGWGR